MAREGGKDRGLFQRDGAWWIRYHDSQGKERREKAGTKAQAKNLYSKRQAEKLTRKKLPETLRKPELSLKDVVAKYRHLMEAKVTARDDERISGYWLAYLNSCPLAEVTPHMVELWREKRTAAGKSIATVNREIAWLRWLYNLAIRDGVHEGRNPAAVAGTKNPNNTRVRWLTDDEERRLRAAMTDEDWRLVEVAILTGMRMSEQFGLRREDCDMKAGVLTLLHAKDPKSGAAGKTRYIHLGPRGKALFREILKSHESPWVFPASRGDGPLNTDNVRKRVLAPALKKAKVRDFRWHDLRHTYGSRLAMAGVELQQIRDLMGHASIVMTEKYAHLCPSKLKQAVAGL